MLGKKGNEKKTRREDMRTEKQKANLIMFEKGNKGGGRPKGSTSIVTHLKKFMRSSPKGIPTLKKIVEAFDVKTVGEAAAVKLLLLAFDKKIKSATQLSALKELIDRVDGKVQTDINLGIGKNLKDLDVTKLSDEELDDVIRKLSDLRQS